MYKFVVVLNPQFEFPALANAVGHAMIGLTNSLSADQLSMRKFLEVNDLNIGSLTDHPLIILKSKRQAHLKRLAMECVQDPELESVVFLDQHRRHAPDEQQRSIGDYELLGTDIVSVAIFGEMARVSRATKRCSLF